MSSAKATFFVWSEGVAVEELLDEVRRVIESCKKIIRPIRRIPEYIVQKILDADEREIKDSLDGESRLLVLSMVGRNWRSVATPTSQVVPFTAFENPG